MTKSFQISELQYSFILSIQPKKHGAHSAATLRESYEQPGFKNQQQSAFDPFIVDENMARHHAAKISGTL